MRNFLKNFLVIFSVLLLVAGVVSLVTKDNSKRVEVIGVGRLAEEINAGAVKKIVIQGDLLHVTFKDA